ncbi:MAG: hypothetical protein PF692_01925 [Kiritimatiellae bacterium]|jgi:hypothetical protein|nr:hypothetical protein [Kiritimatiellia bacterium]
MFNIPTLTSDNPTLDQAFRIAVGDFTGNIILWQDGLLKNRAPAIMAGLDYIKPWTRDASFNTWYAGANLAPDCAKNTLLSVLTENKTNGLRIGGQYWDATGFVNMLYKGLLGMKFTPEGLVIKPKLPQGMKALRLSNFTYRNAVLDIKITEKSTEHFIPFDTSGEIIV